MRLMTLSCVAALLTVGAGTDARADGVCDLNNPTAGCWMLFTDFMNTEYDYTDPATGIRYTASSTLESARNQGVSASFISPGSMLLETDCARNPTGCPAGHTGRWYVYSAAGNALPEYWKSVKMGYLRPAQFPDVILFSKMQSPYYTAEVFRSDSSPVNTVHVLSEPRFKANRYVGYWQHPGEAAMFSDRGYFWSHWAFPVQPIGGGVWRGTRRDNNLTGGLTYNLGGYKSPLVDPDPETHQPGYWQHQPVIENHVAVKQYAYADFYPAGFDWYNHQPQGVHAMQANAQMPRTGNLPSDLHVLVLAHGGTDSTGKEIWMERYFYGVRTNGQALGMIGYDNYVLNTDVCPQDWTPNTALFPGAVCWGQMARQISFQFDRLKRDSEYGTYIDPARGNYTLASNYAFWSAILRAAELEVHNPKLAWRNPNTPTEVVDKCRPHFRGAFKAPGNGADYTGRAVSAGQTIALESNLFIHDFYVYPAFTDSFVPAGQQCRSGYQYQGGLVTDEVWSGVDRSDHTGHQWLVLCSTSADIMYFGGSSCAPGYAQRGYFYSNYESYVSDTPAAGFHMQPAGSWVNLCVRADQALLQSDLPTFAQCP